MSDFKAKMHQIRFLLKLRVQRSPGSLAVFKGPLIRGQKGEMREEGTGSRKKERVDPQLGSLVLGVEEGKKGEDEERRGARVVEYRHFLTL